MLGPGEHPTIGKDSIFSVMMIIMNLVMGLCILLGGLKYGEQEYNTQGTVSYLGMIILLGGISMLLPNYIEGAGSGIFTTMQATTLSILIVVLYGFFLFFQMRGYRHLYVQPKMNSMETLFAERHATRQAAAAPGGAVKDHNTEMLIRSIILLAMIVPIVLLSDPMAVVVDYGITAGDLPPLLGGVLIATIVFTPES